MTDLTPEALAEAIARVVAEPPETANLYELGGSAAVPLLVPADAYESLREVLRSVSDEHMMQQLAHYLSTRGAI